MTLPGRVNEFFFVAFSPDGRWLAACGLEGKFHLWRPHPGRRLKQKKQSCSWDNWPDSPKVSKFDTQKTDAHPFETAENCHVKTGDTRPHTLESLNNLITLYEDWNKTEQAKECRAKLPQTEAKTE
jgi:hypothetical protein